ncbi:MAG: 50S ribosomal protein L30 [Propionibacteriaceae bacterium]|jgi:large subunit ribosomal protein L30|nr:50S ribosomal protein L30 [Propionibacteriaceae bacterium]
MATSDKNAPQVRITQIRSTIAGLKNQKATLRTLGLKKIGDSVEREYDDRVRGMVRTVSHLVTVEEVD